MIVKILFYEVVFKNFENFIKGRHLLAKSV